MGGMKESRTRGCISHTRRQSEEATKKKRAVETMNSGRKLVFCSELAKFRLVFKWTKLTTRENQSQLALSLNSLFPSLSLSSPLPPPPLKTPPSPSHHQPPWPSPPPNPKAQIELAKTFHISNCLHNSSSLHFSVLGTRLIHFIFKSS